MDQSSPVLGIGVESELQLAAGLALLESSSLVRWDDSTSSFIAIPPFEFDAAWQARHPVFGRLMCWNSFSTGAELFLKGVCFSNGVDWRGTQSVLDYPSGDVDEWLNKYGTDPSSLPRARVTKFGELKTAIGHLPAVAAAANAAREDLLVVGAAFDLLRGSIRNRDSHAYVPNVRAAHHPLVESLFCRALNVLSSWLPSGPSSLKRMR